MTVMIFPLKVLTLPALNNTDNLYLVIKLLVYVVSWTCLIYLVLQSTLEKLLCCWIVFKARHHDFSHIRFEGHNL